MARPVDPGRDSVDRSGGDSDRMNHPDEPADPRVLDEAADQPIHESRDFPSGGGAGGGPGTPGGQGGDPAADAGES